MRCGTWVLAGLLVVAAGGPLAADGTSTLVVPDSYSTIQAAVDAAQPGDTVWARAGTYAEAVRVEPGKEGLILRGDGAGLTILDGGSDLDNGIYVTADDVAVQDLTARRYTGNGVYFDGVDGFTMERLAAEDNGVYGLYAIRSQHGAVRDSVAHGHGDAGIYVGESLFCFCVVERNEAWDNVNGYSGTASNYITLRENDFHHNRLGISLSVLPSEPGLQEHATIIHNKVHDNNNPVEGDPVMGYIEVPVGVGIAIAGGWSNAVVENEVWGNDLWGITMFWLTTEPSENQVKRNTLWDNGVDLWWDEGGLNNCWEDNSFASSDPAALPGCDPILPVGGISNVGVPSPCKLLFLVLLTLLQGGEPGAPYHTPAGDVPALPWVCGL